MKKRNQILQRGERFFKNHLNQGSSFFIQLFRLSLRYWKQNSAEKHWQLGFW